MGLPRPPAPASLVRDLARVVGRDAVSVSDADRLAHAHDRWTRDVLESRGGMPTTAPDAVVWPATGAEAAELLAWASRAGVEIVPYGFGLGRNGSCRPTRGGVALATARWRRISDLDLERGTVHVEGGASLPAVESWLEARGYSAHLDPFADGTLGGALALRSTGLPGGRWGALEDRLETLELATAHGAGSLSGRSQPHLGVGPLVVGAEGSFAVVSGAELRVRPKPPFRGCAAYRLRGWARGVEVLRALVQSGLRPDVLQLHDGLEGVIGPTSANAGPERTGADLLDLVLPPVPAWLPAGSTLARGAERLRRRALRQTTSTVVGRAGALNRALEVLPDEAQLLLVFSGETAAVVEEMEAARQLVVSEGGEALGPDPVEVWWKGRVQAGFREPRLYATGLYMDVIDASATWDRIVPLHRAVKKALGRDTVVTSRITHAYASGAALELSFMGVAGHPRRAAEAVQRHGAAVRRALVAVHEMGATLAHHRGVGEARATAMGRELGRGGRQLLGALNRAFDPSSVLNPGKFGVDAVRPPPPGRGSRAAGIWQPALTAAVGPRNVRQGAEGLLVRPPDERALAAVLRIAHAHAVAVVSEQFDPRRAVERAALDREGLVLELDHLDGIARISQHSAFVEVEAGVSLEHLEKVLSEHDLTLGPLHPRALRSTVGGALARGELRRRGLAFGELRDVCLSLRALLPTGEAIETRRGPRTGAGPDLKAVFEGAGASYGIVTRASLRLSARPPHATSLQFVFPGLDAALVAIRRMLWRGLRPAAAKVWMDGALGHLGLDLIDSAAGLLDAQVETAARIADELEGWGAGPAESPPPPEQGFDGVVEADGSWAQAASLFRALAAATREETWLDFLTPWEVTVVSRASGGARRASARAAAISEGARVDTSLAPAPSARATGQLDRQRLGHAVQVA
ncbi:MAG: FAD-binding oxidoreductase [Myxococcota bacterium]